MAEADYVDDFALLANTLAQAEYLLQAAGGISLCVNANKAEIVCFKSESVLNLFTESNISIRITKRFILLLIGYRS